MALVSRFSDDASRWKALEARDASADGFFVYGVKSTKIYCRPVCKARLARRANVTFYATGEHARDAGFRACKRCRPDLAGLMPEEAAIQKIRAFVQMPSIGAQGGPLTPGRMAEQTGLSKWHFHRIFKKCTGVTPAEYLKLQRTATHSQSPTIRTKCFVSADPSLFSVQDGDSFTSEVGDCDPLSLDDLLIWPEDDPSLAR